MAKRNGTSRSRVFTSLVLVLLAACDAGPISSGESGAGGGREAGPAAPPPRGDANDAGTTPSPARDGGSPDPGSDPETPDLPGLGDHIRGKMAALRLPGVAAAIVKGDRLVWSRGYGFAHVAKKIPVTTATLFHLASVSKTVTATAVMQMVEAGIALDDDVSASVGFSVRNPRFASTPITLRMLLAHTSSISDSEAMFDLVVKDKPSPVSLQQFVTGYFTVGGTYYNATNNFGTAAPGSAFAYSNAGMTLAGYVAEARSKIPFDDYCKAQIFSPLGMTESSFRLASLDVAHIAMQYDSDGVTALGNDDYPDFPDGGLRTSVNQFARFLLMFMNGGAYANARILKADTVKEMMRVQFPALEPGQGLAWYYETRKGRRVLGHGGTVPGVSTMMGFNPATKVGAILFSNGNAHSESQAASDGFDAILDHLFDVGEAL